MDIINKINDIVWNPMAYFALALGLYFTLLLRGVQFRLLPDMIRQLTAHKVAEEGTSPMQAVLLTLASRVGVGNIAGVATALAAGGPGALFWMVLVALLGAASAFAESTLAQVYKAKVQGEHRGGMPFYVEKGLRKRWLGVILALMTLIGYGFLFPSVQSNNIASSMKGAFNLPVLATAIIVTVLLGLVIIGGTRRIVRVAQILVPVMAFGYVIAAFAIIAVHYDKIIPTISMVFMSAIGKDQIFGGMAGAAVAWGVRRAVFSNVAGVGEGTFGAASAAVSHPAKQGLVQAFSIFVDTVVVCHATGIMILMTGVYNVTSPSGEVLFEGAPEITSPGAVNTQAAIDTIMPGIGPGFVAVALFLFAFTTLVAFYYIANTNLLYLLRDRYNEWWGWLLKIGMLAITFYGGIEAASVIWGIGDIGYGSLGWVNMICILLLSPVVYKVLRDYDQQRKDGLEPLFDPRKLGIRNAEFWTNPDNTGVIPAVRTTRSGKDATQNGGKE